MTSTTTRIGLSPTDGKIKVEVVLRRRMRNLGHVTSRHTEVITVLRHLGFRTGL